MDVNSEASPDGKMQTTQLFKAELKYSVKIALSEQAGPCGDQFVSTEPQDKTGVLPPIHRPERSILLFCFLPQYSFGHSF